MSTQATAASLGDEWSASLQATGYRLTAPRRVIIDLMVASDRALEPLDVYHLARRAHPGLGLVTVYRTLERLVELGLLERVHQPSGCHRYFRSPNGHEHLLVCTKCGHTEFFSGDDVTELVRAVSNRTGFDIREHWLQLIGQCPECRDA